MSRVRHDQGESAGALAAPTGASVWGHDPAHLYRAHVHAIHRYMATRVGDDVAEELTAQTFVEAWAEREGYDPELGSPRRWIFGIAHNVLSHHYRQERRRAAGYVAMAAQRRLANWMEAFEDEVCEAFAAAERAARLELVLRGTEQTDRELLVLGAQPDVTYQVMADAFDIPVGTVRSRLSRARRRLANQIDGTEPGS